MKIHSLAACVAATLCLAWAAQAGAQARIVLNNIDAPNVGLNDPTPMTPTGGNPGTTLGEQRRIAYQYAMDLWGSLLSSNTEIRVSATFAPLTCEIRDGAPYIVLGQAGTKSSVMGSRFGSPNADFSYPVAMANAIAGQDFTPGADHIQTFFSGAIDTPACQAIGGSGWYYGLQGNGGNTGGKSNFLNVIMHEIGHGLGMQGQSQLFFGSIPARFSKSRYDQLAFSNRFAKSFNDFATVSDADMGTALVTPGDVGWTGALANPTARLIADHRQLLRVDAPQAAQYDIAPASFGNQDLARFPAGEVVLVRDVAVGDAAATSLDCDSAAIANGEALRGKIALVDRGACEFGLKALNAQKHGAIAVLLANNVAGEPFGPSAGTFGGQVMIPVVGVSQAGGQGLRAPGPVTVSGVADDPDRFYGLDPQRRLRLYTPAVYSGGSTFSHVDTDMSPNALMEPAETSSLQSHIYIDVALDMFEDLGWPTNRNGTARLGDCDTQVPMIRDSFIPGANIVAQNNLCKTGAAGSRSKYLRCMSDHLQSLNRGKYIDSVEMAKARQCVARQ